MRYLRGFIVYQGTLLAGTPPHFRTDDPRPGSGAPCHHFRSVGYFDRQRVRQLIVAERNRLKRGWTAINQNNQFNSTVNSVTTELA